MEKVDIIAEFRAHIARYYVNRTKAAEHWGVSVSFLDKIAKGERQPSKKMLDDMGYEKAPLTYRRKARSK